MGNLFSKGNKKVSRVTEQDKAILQIKHQRDQIQVYQKRIEKTIQNDRVIAKKCLQSGRIERAKLLLKKKKYQEKLLENTDNQIENIERLISDIEFSLIEQNVIEGLKAGNTALKQLNNILKVEDVENILEETQEAIAKQNEINDIITGVLTTEDENDILAELDMLTKEESDEEINLPNVPNDELIQEPAKEHEPKKTLVAA